MRTALHGTVKKPPVEAEIAENPVTGNHELLSATYPESIGSSNEYSMVKVAEPVRVAPKPTLKGLRKLSRARTALLPVPVLEVTIGVIWNPILQDWLDQRAISVGLF
jgi:hypothetical protein